MFLVRTERINKAKLFLKFLVLSLSSARPRAAFWVPGGVPCLMTMAVEISVSSHIPKCTYGQRHTRVVFGKRWAGTLLVRH